MKNPEDRRMNWLEKLKSWKYKQLITRMVAFMFSFEFFLFDFAALIPDLWIF